MERGPEKRQTTALIPYGDCSDGTALASSPHSPSSRAANAVLHPPALSLPPGLTLLAHRCMVCLHPQLFVCLLCVLFVVFFFFVIAGDLVL